MLCPIFINREYSISHKHTHTHTHIYIYIYIVSGFYLQSVSRLFDHRTRQC